MSGFPGFLNFLWWPLMHELVVVSDLNVNDVRSGTFLLGSSIFRHGLRALVRRRV